MAITELAGAPYYAVIFTSLRTEGDNGYAAMAAQMEDLGREQPGFLGIDSARSGVGITVSYWRDLESIRAWKANWEHLVAQLRGQREWYSEYTVRVCRVEYEYRQEAASRD
jgi:heme-degrading monooxygenase HmoA